MDKWDIFEKITDAEKEELSDHLYHFHDEYENNFCDYFDYTKENEELEDFMFFYKGLYELIDKLLERSLED
jgi:hypothetical protein